MTLYTAMQAHQAKHKYTKGEYKGAAPLQTSKRWRSHERILNVGENMVLRFHNTDVITVTPDNKIIFKSDGWHSNPTTRQSIADFMTTFQPHLNHYYFFHSTKYKEGGVLRVSFANMTRQATMYRFSEGITFDLATGFPLTPLETFTKTVAARAVRKEFKACEGVTKWKALLPVLMAGAMEIKTPKYISPRMYKEVFSDPDADAIAVQSILRMAYGDLVHDRRTYNYTAGQWDEPTVTPKDVWNRIMTQITNPMTTTIDTGITHY